MMKSKFAAKKPGLISLCAILVMMLAATVCDASPITYSVNRTVGTGTVTGFIQTDGTLGVLAPANFLNWTLNLVVGVDTFTLTGANSTVYIQGVDTTATATQILFNFS